MTFSCIECLFAIRKIFKFLEGSLREMGNPILQKLYNAHRVLVETANLAAGPPLALLLASGLAFVAVTETHH